MLSGIISTKNLAAAGDAGLVTAREPRHASAASCGTLRISGSVEAIARWRR